VPARSDTLKFGLQALEQGRYSEAVTALENYCERAETNTQAHLQAQMWLVKAYQGNGQPGKATHLCRQLANSPHQQVQAWARQTLSLLCRSPASNDEVFSSTGGSPAQQPPSSTTESPGTESTATAPTVQTLNLKPLRELKHFYRKTLRRDLAKFERSRQATLQVLVAVNALLIAILVAALIYGGRYLLFPAVVGFVLLWVFCHALITRSYGKGFKTRIIKKIVEFIDVDQVLQYAENIQLDRTLAAFQHSTIFGDYFPDRFRQDDCVWGQIGETSFFFSEICAETESADLAGIAAEGFFFRNLFGFLRSQASRQGLGFTGYLGLIAIKGIPHAIMRIFWGRKLVLSDFFEETDMARKMLFKGLFFRANFNKRFQGRTVVLPDMAERFLGRVARAIQSWNKSRGELIQLEDPEFERFFAVYGDDQIEARYILSTSLMARLTDLRKKAGHDVYVGFVGDTLYIGVKFDEDLFEPKLFSTMLSFEPIQEYYETLRLMLDIVEDLKLNRRIWKQG